MEYSKPRPELDFDRKYRGCNELIRRPERCNGSYWQVDFFIPSGIFRSGLSKATVKLGNVTDGKEDDVWFW